MSNTRETIFPRCKCLSLDTVYIFFSASSIQSRGFHIYSSVDNATDNRRSIYNNSAADPEYEFVIQLKPPIIMQFIEVEKSILGVGKSTVLAICEFRLIQSGK